MKKILKDWSLIIAMLAGVLGYFLYVNIPFLKGTYAFANEAVAFVQPALIFCMLLLTFCRINPAHLKFCKWHLWLLLVQSLTFCAIGTVLIWMPQSGWRVVLEGAMIMLICPTATAAAVITRKLGGDLQHITTYTILINLVAAVVIPVMLPYVHPHPGMTTFNASMLILGKVFPLLLLPLIIAILLRYLFPKVQQWFADNVEASFYLWLVALALAIAVTTRSIMHTHVDIVTQLWLVVISLVCCLGQFWAGRKLGGIYGEAVTAGQALGQKNTVFAIWLGYTFFTPITAVVGGFYSVWHNLVNSYQLYRHEHKHHAMVELKNGKKGYAE